MAAEVNSSGPPEKKRKTSQYKLTYFDGRGHAEIVRYMFALAGQDYEDVRLTTEEWLKFKPDTPFRQCPVLEVDGVQIGQHKAIARFIAKRFNYLGATDIEAALIDMIVDCMDDILRPAADLYTLKMAKDPNMAEIQKKLEEETIPGCLEKFEKLLKNNKGGDGYFVGDGVTFADLYFAQTITWLEPNHVKVNWDKVPKLKALKQRVENLPKIAEWIKKRPKTEY